MDSNDECDLPADGDIGAASQSSDDGLAKVFISYSRNDRPTAERLLVELRRHNLTPYLDLQDLAPGELWQIRLASLIAAADAVVFLLSPDSLSSRICDWEVNEAERIGKRIFPAVVRDVAADQVPGRLQRLNYAWLRRDDDWPAAVAKLRDGILIDIGWVREGTRLTGLALYWMVGDKLNSNLLQGRALSDAENWLAARPGHAPSPKPPLLDYLECSRDFRVKEEERRQADLDRLAQFQSNALARESFSLCGLGDRSTALHLAIEAIQDQRSLEFNPHNQQAVDALQECLLGIREVYIRRYDASPSPERKAVVAFGSGIVAVCTGSQCSLYDAHTGDLTALLAPHTGDITACAFEANGRYLATAETGVIRLWNPITAEAYVTVTVPDLEITLFKINPADSDQILCGVPNDPNLFLIDLETGMGTVLSTQQPEQMFDVVWSPNGDLFVTSCNNLHAELWFAKQQKRICEIDYSSGGWPMYVRFSADGTKLFCMSRDRIQVTTLNDFVTTVPVRSIQFFFHGLVSAPGDKLHVIKKNDIDAILVDEDFNEIRTLSGNARMLQGAQFSPCGRLVCLEFADQYSLFEVESGLELANFHIPGTAPLSPANDFEGHAWFTGDSTRFVALCEDGTLRSWRTTLEQNRVRLIGHTDNIDCAAFHPDGELLATSGDDGTARIWDVSSGECVHIEQFPESNFVVVQAFSADGRWLALTEGGKNLIVLDVRSWTRVVNLAGVSHSATCAVFDPESTVLAVSGTADGPSPANAIRFFDVEDWTKQPRTLELPIGASKLLFDRSGRQLLSYGCDAIIRLTDVVSLKLILEQDTGSHSYGPLCWTQDFRGFFFAPPVDNTRTYLAHFDIETKTLTRIETEFLSIDGIVVVPGGHGLVLRGSKFDGGSKLTHFSTSLTVELSVIDAAVGNSKFQHYFDVNESGDFVVSAFDRWIELRETRFWQTIATFSFHGSPIRAIQFAPDGKAVVSCSSTGEVYVWRPQFSLTEALDLGKAVVHRGLTVPERNYFGLDESPPRWYIEMKKFSYDEEDWSNWLSARDRGEPEEFPVG